MKPIALTCCALALLLPTPSFSEELPAVRSDHPRLGFRPEGTPGARTFSQVRALYRSNETFRGYFLPAQEIAEDDLKAPSEPLLLAACWVATGEERFAQAAMAALETAELKPTAQSDYYSPVWEFALAYDWLFNHPDLTEARKRAIEKRLADVLESELNDCDGGYSVVWHGRTQLANNAFVATLALTLDPRAEEFQRRAYPHFVEAVRALSLSEGWPEGTGYWIHNRALPFGLAADCFITATGKTSVEGMDLREMLRRTALWQLYSLQPDFRFVRYGDTWEDGLISGPGLWQPIADYYARLSGAPEAVAAADYFRLHSKHLYHAGRYGWSAVLTYDPSAPMPAGYDAARPEAYLNTHLPHTAVIGRWSLGQAFLTNGWGDPNAPWISFKAGDVMAHHGHYDQGSFTIYCGSPLAVHAGQYGGDYVGEYRLGYFLQTVSKNSLLIHAPGEFSQWNRRREYFEAITGGQRVIMPTGSHIVSVNDYLRNRFAGQHFAAGEMSAYESSPGEYDYFATDLTRAYNSTLWAEPGNPAKVSEVTRKLVYLREPGAVVTLDRVMTTEPSYRVDWLLHTPAKPETATERQVEGTPEDGILATDDRWMRTAFGQGQLFQQSLLPERAEILKIGGPSYRNYVEFGEERRNLEFGGRRGEEPDRYGVWRVQIQAPTDSCEHLFLNVLWPRLASEAAPPRARLVSQDEKRIVVAVGEWVVVFAVSGELSPPLTYEAPAGTKHHLIVDLYGRSEWEVHTPEGTSDRTASVEGVLRLDAGAGPVTLAEERRKGGGNAGYQ